MSQQEQERFPVGARVVLTTVLNGGRYNGRSGRVVEHASAGRLVVLLDEFTPGFDSPDGRVWLSPDEVRLAPIDVYVVRGLEAMAPAELPSPHVEVIGGQDFAVWVEVTGEMSTGSSHGPLVDVYGESYNAVLAYVNREWGDPADLDWLRDFVARRIELVGAEDIPQPVEPRGPVTLSALLDASADGSSRREYEAAHRMLAELPVNRACTCEHNLETRTMMATSPVGGILDIVDVDPDCELHLPWVIEDDRERGHAFRWWFAGYQCGYATALAGGLDEREAAVLIRVLARLLEESHDDPSGGYLERFLDLEDHAEFEEVFGPVGAAGREETLRLLLRSIVDKVDGLAAGERDLIAASDEQRPQPDTVPYAVDFLLTVDDEPLLDGVRGAHEPTLDGDDVVCPKCGGEIEQWADDGEADLADWWACLRPCGAKGAFVRRSEPTVTQNGLPVDEPRTLEVRVTVKVPARNDDNAQTVADELAALIDAHSDPDMTPSLHSHGHTIKVEVV